MRSFGEVLTLLANLSRRERILAGITISGLLIYAVVNFLYAPYASRLQSAEQQLITAQSRYAAAVRNAKNTAKLSTTSTAKKVTDAATPVAQFLKEIESAAGSQIQINRFQPHKSRLSANKRLGSQGRTPIMTLQVEIDCLGSLAAIVAFIDKIEKSDAFTRVHNTYFTPENRGGRKIKCQITITRLLPA